ncbi:serine/threonine-protein phosphatase 7 long form-like protein [Hibiscus syriacus]|uniref:Serine/threonine-protein phosphatase 7 long form-like protein n=1 Tax=Hibiscus syriacus TaxID=106335 RepID=A0A6A2Z543_HIBSY|nr:uncharacterized protein LOC120150522 [Hibiscus syriacus]KAE8687124.1 serine/threonine-protein phosphatase 7 long form-like protein [Hibiscus syriacus]
MATEGLLFSLYEGCISGCDITVERRPYHRNCQCALHDKSRGNCPHASAKSKTVSYPLRRAWSEGCLALSAASSCHSSPSSSPARSAGIHGAAGKHHMESCKEEEEDNNIQLESTIKLCK